MWWNLGSREVRGRERRQETAKRELRLSRMQAARAMVSRGRFALDRRDWARGVEVERREAAQGIRLVR